MLVLRLPGGKEAEQHAEARHHRSQMRSAAAEKGSTEPTKQKRVGFCHRTHPRAARRQLLLREEAPAARSDLLPRARSTS